MFQPPSWAAFAAEDLEAPHQQEDQATALTREGEQLLSLFDSIWFGEEEEEQEQCDDTPRFSSHVLSLGRRRPNKQQQSARGLTADPLDNVVPLYLPLLPDLQPNGGLAALQQPQQPPLPPQQQQQLLLQQQQQPPSPLRYAAAGAAALHTASTAGGAAAIRAPSQPLPVGGALGSAAVPTAIRASSRGRAAYAADTVAISPVQAAAINTTTTNLQQQQQQDEPKASPAPFVLGTWAQRQYIMPLQRPTGQGAAAAAVEDATGAAGTPPAGAAASERGRPSSGEFQPGSSSPARPIPYKGRYAGSSGSTHSSGASMRSKAAAGPGSGSGGRNSGSSNHHQHHAAHSSSGGSSEAVPAAAAKEAAADAAAAADDAAAAQNGDDAAAGKAGAAANGDDAAAVELWQQAAEASAAEVEAAVAAATAGGQRPGRRSLESDDGSVGHGIWRWKFARRWNQAQRPPDAADGAGSPDGDMEEALAYLAACGDNWHHLSRGSSQLGTMESRVLGTLGSYGGLGSELLADDSFSALGSGMQGTLQSTAESGGALAASCREASGAGDSSSDGQPLALRQQQQQAQGGLASQQPQQAQQQPQQQPRRSQRSSVRPEATAQVTGITRRAHQLLEAQKDISQAAQERWQQVSGKQGGKATWVGAMVEGTQVPQWGKFKFLLLRMRDHDIGGRSVTLVRGQNDASEARIVEELHKQMIALCTAHQLPVAAIEVLGGGVMEWTMHRDRHLHISGGYVARSGAPGGPATAGDVMRLTAVLTQQALPMHYKVTC